MGHPVYNVPNDALGQLLMMPCPAADGLEEAIGDLKRKGVTIVLSMLAYDEMAQLGVQNEESFCEAQAVRFLSYPIQDFGLPNLNTFAALIDRVTGMLQAGEHVVVHCRAGIGRSGMVAACVLVALGQNAKDAIKTVSQARGVSIPDTVEQGRFIVSFEKHANRVN